MTTQPRLHGAPDSLSLMWVPPSGWSELPPTAPVAVETPKVRAQHLTQRGPGSCVPDALPPGLHGCLLVRGLRKGGCQAKATRSQRGFVLGLWLGQCSTGWTPTPLTSACAGNCRRASSCRVPPAPSLKELIMLAFKEMLNEIPLFITEYLLKIAHRAEAINTTHTIHPL